MVRKIVPVPVSLYSSMPSIIYKLILPLLKSTKPEKKGPGTKGFGRKSRLTIAVIWIRNYNGKNIIKGYSKHFGVDKLCTIKELEMLGVQISEERKKQIINSHKQLIEQRRKRKELREQQEINLIDSDETFAFIAGYTAGGAPFGITWEQQLEDDIEKYGQDEELPW